MKIILFTVLITSTLLAQSESANSILKLEQEIKTANFSEQNPNVQTVRNNTNAEKKSVGLAILYSLLLPGMGELYADGYSSGKYFTIAEGVLWGTYIGMNVYASNQEDNYKAFAKSRASINPDGKNDDYFATISEYSDIDTYNDQKALERNFDQMYDRDKFFWKWGTTAERKEYRSIWSSSEQTYNDLQFVVGAMILNRSASAINAVRLVSAYNSNLDEELSWNVSAGLKNNPNLPTSLEITFYKSF